jgi:CheY-like chemotaxis protein
VADEILIVDSTPEIARVLCEALIDDGYDAQTAVGPASSAVAAARARRPDALAVGLPPDAEQAGAALDALRTDSVTREIPVLTLSAVTQINDAARASYTVRETLDEPFDLDEASATVARTLADPPIQALVGAGAPDPLFARVEPVLAEHARAVLLDWTKSRRAEEPWPSQSDSSLAEVMDGTPTLVDAIDASLRAPEPAALFSQPEVVARIADRARRRRDRGVGRDGAVDELGALRNQLWATLERHLPTDLSGPDADRVRATLDEAMDRIVALTLPAYDEASPTA